MALSFYHAYIDHSLTNTRIYKDKFQKIKRFGLIRKHHLKVMPVIKNGSLINIRQLPYIVESVSDEMKSSSPPEKRVAASASMSVIVNASASSSSCSLRKCS